MIKADDPRHPLNLAKKAAGGALAVPEAQGPEPIASLAQHLRRMSDTVGDAIDADRLARAANLLVLANLQKSVGAELIRAEREVLCLKGSLWAIAHPAGIETKEDLQAAALAALQVGSKT